jgi:hypothetical protein
MVGFAKKAVAKATGKRGKKPAATAVHPEHAGKRKAPAKQHAGKRATAKHHAGKTRTSVIHSLGLPKWVIQGRKQPRHTPAFRKANAVYMKAYRYHHGLTKKKPNFNEYHTRGAAKRASKKTSTRKTATRKTTAKKTTRKTTRKGVAKKASRKAAPKKAAAKRRRR